LENLCLEFVNSSWYITHKTLVDPLSDAAWLMKLADKWNIKSLSAPTEGQIASLIETRSKFAKLLDKAIEGDKLTGGDVELVNNYMLKASFYRQLQDEKGTFKLCEVPESSDWNWFIAEVAASYSKLYSSTAVNRLKKCQNTECGWFFIDESKSGNRKWCDDTCATLIKVRRFRQKQKKNHV
jgi:predicted RNA-binding Zn ribbon-like protein